MTAIALVTANRVSVVEPIWQKTLVAAEAIVAGAPVRIDTAGKFTNANGTTTTENRVWGVGTRTVAAGEPLTAVRNGTLDGYDLSGMAYDAPVYLSDTDGRLDTAAGTVSTVVGRVVPGTSTTLGTAYDKILSVEL
jgi:hypothetical protein